MIEATAQQEAAANAVRKTLEPDDLPRLRAYARIFGTDTVVKNRAAYLDARPRTNAENQARTAQQARAEIEALRALTLAEAVARIKQIRANEQAQREAADFALKERRRQVDVHRHTLDSGPRSDGPSLGW